MRLFRELQIVLLLSALGAHNASAQKEYLDEVFKIVEEHSLRRDSLDIDKIKKEAYSRLDRTQSVEDCYPIVRFILSEIGDRHSFFMDKNQVVRWESTSKTTKASSPLTFRGEVLNENIGFIHMRGFSSGDSISILEYANNLQALIKTLDGKKIRGWIIDLRENSGGNCWPMLSGLGPLLGNGTCGYFIYNNLDKSNWYYKDGVAGENSKQVSKVSNLPYHLIKENNSIAILTGGRTASSGELIVTSFRGKGNSKSFGMPTAGLSTGNEEYRLSDGSMILLTISKFADRFQNVYGGKINPDNFVEFNYSELNTTNDLVIKSAMQWIYRNK